jgi:uncharacterized protein
MSQPGVIDGLQFARNGSEIQGTIEPERFRRLAEMDCRVLEARFALRGGTNAKGKPSLDLEVAAVLEVQCQRCLERMRWPVELDVELELSQSEQEIAQADDDTDRVLATPGMDVAQMVEDELILALPDSPRHEDCEVPGGTGDGRRASPFDALARLKGGKGN